MVTLQQGGIAGISSCKINVHYKGFFFFFLSLLNFLRFVLAYSNISFQRGVCQFSLICFCLASYVEPFPGKKQLFFMKIKKQINSERGGVSHLVSQTV